jgi:hypothetical protein
VAQATEQDDATIVPEDVSQLLSVYPVVTGLGALHLGIIVHPENEKVPPLLAQAATAVPVYPVAQLAEQADAAIVAEAVLQLVNV